MLDLSTERPNATINVEDYEMLNVCAFYIKGAVNPDTKKPSPEIIIPTESYKGRILNLDSAEKPQSASATLRT